MVKQCAIHRRHLETVVVVVVINPAAIKIQSLKAIHNRYPIRILTLVSDIILQ